MNKYIEMIKENIIDFYNNINIRKKLLFFKQKVVRGWDDSETYSLYYTIAKFTLPRLKVMKELHYDYPMGLTPEKWDEILDDIIFTFEIIVKDYNFLPEGCDAERYERGIKYFGEYFLDLWW
jgi:hypothetical protein